MEDPRITKFKSEFVFVFEQKSQKKVEMEVVSEQTCSKYIICFEKYLNFAKIKAIMYFAKFLNAFVKPRNLNFSRNKLHIFRISKSPASK